MGLHSPTVKGHVCYYLADAGDGSPIRMCELRGDALSSSAALAEAIRVESDPAGEFGGRYGRDTRDIAVRTATEVFALRREVDEFMRQSREEWTILNEKLERYDAYINKGKGGWYVVMAISAAFGYVLSIIFPHLDFLGRR